MRFKKYEMSSEDRSRSELHFRQWGEWEPGDKVIVKYAGNDHSALANKLQDMFLFKVMEVPFFADNEGKVINEGDLLALYKTHMLTQALSDLGEDFILQIEYKGRKKAVSGRRYIDLAIAYCEDEKFNDDESEDLPF